MPADSNISTPFLSSSEAATSYDYIIAGSGCAGLSLAVHLIQSKKFRNKKILLVDKVVKTGNDRTWCFWEKEEGLFQACVHKEWDHLLFYAQSFSKELAIEPYKYKLIRSHNFYTYCINLIKEQSNFTIVQGAVTAVSSNANETSIIIDERKINCNYLFNSILFEQPQLGKHHYWLLQHFKGWFIKSDVPCFDSATATLMDFRTGQANGTAFFYVLPFSETEALVEYTLFSDTLLQDEQYEVALASYIKEHLHVDDYSIQEKEFGIIPMTNYPFSAGEHNLVNIGTAGGQTKGSSGYTFRYIQKHSAALVAALAEEKHPLEANKGDKKFSFYDSVLLNILQHKKLPGDGIFLKMFKNNTPQQVLKFLDNETSFPEDLGIITSLPTLPFAKAAISHLVL